MRFSSVDSRSSCMGPENVDRKTYPQRVDQNSRKPLIIVRSQWGLIGSPRADQPFRQGAMHMRASQRTCFQLPKPNPPATRNHSCWGCWKRPEQTGNYIQARCDCCRHIKLLVNKPQNLTYQAKCKGMRVYVDGESSSDSESDSPDSSCDDYVQGIRNERERLHKCRLFTLSNLYEIDYLPSCTEFSSSSHGVFFNMALNLSDSLFGIIIHIRNTRLVRVFVFGIIKCWRYSDLFGYLWTILSRCSLGESMSRSLQQFLRKF